MARTYQTSRPPKVSASACCACGQGRGDVQQALVGRMRLGSVWLCTGCAERDTNRQTFLAAYVALMALSGTGWHGEPARNQAEEG